MDGTIKNIHTVAEASSFTKASTILNLSQSAISRQIQSLENDLKIKLFESEGHLIHEVSSAKIAKEINSL